jgi:hypothetical protein
MENMVRVMVYLIYIYGCMVEEVSNFLGKVA